MGTASRLFNRAAGKVMTSLRNDFQEGMPDTEARTRSERQLENVREQGGFFVEAVRLTRMPMIVTDAQLPGNPIIFANPSFLKLSGYQMDEVTGQDPHFMNGPETDPATIQAYQAALAGGGVSHVEILQYRKDGAPFRAMLFASPIDDGQGTVLHHFLSYLDVTRQFDAEAALAVLTEQLEAKVAARTAQLQRANAALEVLLDEKQTLMAEVNHRAKNSLTVASALLRIQGRRHPNPEVQSLFAEAEARLLAMAKVHDLLSKSETSQRVNLCAYLHDLCDALRPITEHDDRINLAIECDKAIGLGADQAIALGIIATELVTNAVKYAFPASRSGKIIVAARQLSDTRVEFRVEDDGVGMSAPRDGSLGYSLVQLLVRQLGGKIELRDAPGVRAIISFETVEGVEYGGD